MKTPEPVNRQQRDNQYQKTKARDAPKLGKLPYETEGRRETRRLWGVWKGSESPHRKPDFDQGERKDTQEHSSIHKLKRLPCTRNTEVAGLSRGNRGKEGKPHEGRKIQARGANPRHFKGDHIERKVDPRVQRELSAKGQRGEW